MSQKLFAAIVCLTSMSCTNGNVSAGSDAERTTLCAVADHIESYTGKLISVRARAVTDIRHITLLEDEACIDRRIALVFPSGQEDYSVGPFRDALFAGDPVAQPNRRVTARFTGSVESHPGKIPSRTFVLRSVEELSVMD